MTGPRNSLRSSPPKGGVGLPWDGPAGGGVSPETHFLAFVSPKGASASLGTAPRREVV